MIDVFWLLFIVASLALKLVGAAYLFYLGIAFAGLTFLVKAPVAFFSGVLSAWLRSRACVLTWVYRSCGAILVGLGVRLALARR